VAVCICGGMCLWQYVYEAVCVCGSIYMWQYIYVAVCVCGSMFPPALISSLAQYVTLFESRDGL
jgi:hypothetical protein